MEEDIRKQGMLYLQQQRFGKKWKRVWCVLYRESSCSISRLEFFECKDGGSVEKNDKHLRKHQEQKKVIRLSDCIRVSEVEMEGCPRDTGPFLIETTEKIYVFAADRQQLDEWTHRLCETAFPMSWMEHSVKRLSLQRGNRVDEDEGMEDNSLYSGRETVRDFRVCVRRTEASDRCRLKGDGVLRADAAAVHLLDRGGDVVFSWPYRYLRRFGRDKSTFSFEAGRRCDSGEGSFEFDTKQGNVLFQTVEAAINLQRVSHPLRQASGGGQGPPEALPDPSLAHSRTPPLPQPRSHIPQPPTAQAADGVYSMVTEAPNLQIHHKESSSSSSSSSSQQQQLRTLQCRLEPPVDKTLTGVKSLTLDTRGLPAPRKNPVRMIPSCPLPHGGPEPDGGPRLSGSPDKTYSQIHLPAAHERMKRGGGGGGGGGGGVEPEYSLPFDTIAMNVMADIVNSHAGAPSSQPPDPLYDSIDEMKIRSVFPGNSVTMATAAGPTYAKVEHIYDEPEGCAAPKPAHSVYDEPEEMKRDAWRIMGTAADPNGYEYPYNARADDYAVPKRPHRAPPAAQSTNEEEEEEEEEEEREEEEGGGEEVQEEEEQRRQQQDSPYNNVMVKMT